MNAPRQNTSSGFAKLSLWILITSLCACGPSANDVALKRVDLPETYSVPIIYSLSLSPDGTHVAIESDGDKINIWDWRNRRIDRTVEKVRAAHAVGVTNPLQYSPDGRWLAVCHSTAVGDVENRIWDTYDWSIARDISDPHGGGCIAIGFTQDSQFFIQLVNKFKGPGDNLNVYTTGTWAIQWGLRVDHFEAVSLAVSPDGSQLAIGGNLLLPSTDPTKAGGNEPNIHIVDLHKREMSKIIRGSAMGPMAWSPDGRRLAVVGQTFVEIFDVQLGERLLQERLEKSAHLNARFTSDGRYFIESDMNGLGTGLGVKVWDSRRLKLLQEIPGNVGSIDVSRDAKYLAVGRDGRTSIWQFK